jgi:hypothetical protein
MCLNYLLNAQVYQIPRGLYHFYRGDIPAELQMKAVKEVVGTAKIELPFFIDVEAEAQVDNFAPGLKKFFDLADEFFGQPTGIYSSWGFWDTHVQGLDLTNRPLWVASWTEAGAPVIPKSWNNRWDFWQFKVGDGPSFGTFSRQLDYDVFNGSADDFKKRFDLTSVVNPGGIDIPKFVRTVTTQRIRSSPDQKSTKNIIASALPKTIWPVQTLVKDSFGNTWVKIAEGVFMAYWTVVPA